MTFSNYDAQVSPIYKRSNFLKAQDIYKLELAKLMLKFHEMDYCPVQWKPLNTYSVNATNCLLYPNCLARNFPNPFPL